MRPSAEPKRTPSTFGRVPLTLTGLGAVVALLVAVLLGIGAGRDEEPELGEILHQVRATLGMESEAPPGWRLSGSGRLDGLDLEVRLDFDRRGRFLLEAGGPIEIAAGHDGARSWERRPDGRVRVLEAAGDVDRQLLMNWLVTGYWAAPEAPFDIRFAGTEGSTLLLDLELRPGRHGGRLALDRNTRLPVSFTFEDFGSKGELLFADWQEIEGVHLPAVVRLDNPVGSTLETRWDRATASEGFPGDLFAPQQDRSIAHLPEGPSELEVKVGPHGHLFVKAQVAGVEPGWFVFDTGSTTTMVHTRHRGELGIELLGETSSLGIGGEQRETGMARIGTFRLGGLTVEGLVILVGDFDGLTLGLRKEPSGVIGTDVLSHCVVVYDLPRSRITLYDPELYELPAGGKWIEISDYLGKPNVELVFEGHRGTFLIDTGSSHAVTVAPHVVDELDLLRGRRTTRSRVSGIGGAIAARAGTLAWVEWAGRRLEEVPARFLVENKGAGADRFSAGIIGAGLLRESVVVFDSPGKRMAILAQ